MIVDQTKHPIGGPGRTDVRTDARPDVGRAVTSSCSRRDSRHMEWNGGIFHSETNRGPAITANPLLDMGPFTTYPSCQTSSDGLPRLLNSFSSRLFPGILGT
jgi:hypothetical protein